MTFTNSEVQSARGFLLECLNQGAIPKESIFELAEALGISLDALDSARKKLKVGTCKMDGKVFWVPPDNE
ncbi:MAG: hypothetical protein FWD67_09875 [Betaproteobacteria bacterium]|nr:hypothetical protein [Betaproteobacteria bacterium]